MTSVENSILRLGLLAPVDKLDPHGAWEMGRALVASQIFETPFQLEADASGTTARLFSGPLSDREGAQTLTARLRSGSRFSDGVEVETHHILRSLARSRALEGRARVEARGEEIVFHLPRPDAHFDLALTQLDCAVVRAIGGRVLGTGAFMVGEKREDFIRLVRNPHAAASSEIDEVHVRVYPPEEDGTPTALLQALQDGEVDYTNLLSREQMGGLLGVRKHLEPGNSTALLFVNTERFDPLVRQALAMAIDRSAIAGLFYKNPLAYTATGLLPPKLGGALDGLRYDLDEARRLLQEAGNAVPDSISLRVIWSPRAYLPQPLRVAERLAEQFDALGLRTQVEALEGPEEFNRRIATGQYDLYLGGWIADSPDPADFLEALLSSKSIPQPGMELSNQANFSRWRHEQADQAIDGLRADVDTKARAAILRLVGQEVPVLPLLYGPATAVHTWRLQGFRLNPFGHPDFSTMTLR